MRQLYSQTAPNVELDQAIVSMSWLTKQRITAGIFISKRRVDQTRGLMAYLNRVIYFSCLNAGAIVEGENGRTIDRERLLVAIAASLEGKLTITMTTLWQSTHNLRTNIGAPYSPGAIRRAREVLKDQGILDFDAVESGSTWEPPTLKINLLEALVMAEAAESALMANARKIDKDGDRVNYELEDLPEHRNNMTRLAFNAAFEGICEYRRETLNESSDPIQEPIVPNQAELAKQFLAKVLSAEFWKDNFKKQIRSQWLKRKPKSTTTRSDRSSLISSEQLKLVPF